MLADAYSPHVLLFAVQILGLLGLTLGQMGLRARRGWLLQGLYFCSLMTVAAVLLLGVGVCSHWWLVTGTTFALMVVGATFGGDTYLDRGVRRHESYY